MSLQPGTRLGPYEVLAQIGVGGMGEVYKAKDTRLDRTVAVKILPEHVASDPDLKQRFEREAKTLAALSHPHICPVFDVGRQDGIHFLVMEYLEGDTLAQRLAKGALPIDQALALAIQIAGALDRAHRAGIVHRDLKPGNIMLTKMGAKLLDFGLARVTPTVVGASGLSAAPTLQSLVTMQGTILGTLQYMAPEQIEGQDADTRTDIFAFGAVLYEMLTGKKAFEGKSQASLIGAILKDTPKSIASLQPLTPVAVDRIATTCLAKDPDDRWQTARDLLRELRWAGETGATISTGPALRRSIGRRGLVVWAAATVTTAVAIAAVWSTWRPPPVPMPVTSTRFAVALPFSPEPGDAPVTSVSISQNGRRILYDAVSSGTRQLYLRSLDRVESIPVGPAGGGGGILSPDGEWIGFFNPRDSTIDKIRVGGGQAITIGEASPGNDRSMTWGANGAIVFAGAASGLMQVPEAGGTPRVLTTPTAGEIHIQPSFLPDGRSVLFTIRREGAPDQIAVVDVTNGERRALLAGASPHFASGYLVFLRDATIWAAPYDSALHQAGNDGTPILEGIQVSGGGSGAGVFDLAVNGTLTYSPTLVQERALVWVDRQGRESTLQAPTRPYVNLRLSPDGTRAALEVGTQQQDVWIWDIMRASLTRFNTGRGINRTPIWTPDGSRIVFASNRDGVLNLYSRSADSTGAVDRLTKNSIQQAQGSFSRDGSHLVFRENGPETGRDISVLDIAGGRQVRPLLRSSAREENGELSPDGRWLAYESNESGSTEIYVRPFPNTESGRWQVSADGGTRPVWSRDGLELFWMMPSGSTATMMGAPISTQPMFHVGTPTRLFSGAYYPAPTFRTSERTYDVSPDGRFLVIKNMATEDALPESPSLIVVEHWTDELERTMTKKP